MITQVTKCPDRSLFRLADGMTPMITSEESDHTFTPIAKKWAAEEWEASSPVWLNRPSQDHNYRKYVVEPYLSRLIPSLNLKPDSSVVEIGCGDGSHSLFWRQNLDDLGLQNVHILGIDIVEALIMQARCAATNRKNISFEVADAADSDTVRFIHDAIGVPDLVVSMFLMQDMPDLSGLLSMVDSCLRKGGNFISVIVHPDFAENLRKAGHVKRYGGDDLPPEHISITRIVQWRYIGYYPIVQTDEPPFYLPYFHRNLTDYREAFLKSSFKFPQEMIMMPDTDTSRKLQERGIDPFCDRPCNVYWPLIMQEPSSVLICATKG